jgi:hypothetical protein
MKKVIYLFFTAFFFISISSCVKDTPPLLESSDILTEVQTRGGVSCGPQGNCGPTVPQTLSFSFMGCWIKVYYKTTTCDNVVYFEEESEIVDILSGTCTVDIAFIEGAYAEAIRMHMQNLISQAPSCGGQGDLLLSKQIKTECQRYCIGPSPVGQTNYYWTTCANVQSCCIETTHWCEVEGEVIIDASKPITQNQVGQCEGTFTGTCFQDPGPTPIGYNYCNTARCD